MVRSVLLHDIQSLVEGVCARMPLSIPHDIPTSTLTLMSFIHYSTQASSTQVFSTQVSSTQVFSTQVFSTQVSSTQLYKQHSTIQTALNYLFMF